jgi:hypothetical protein
LSRDERIPGTPLAAATVGAWIAFLALDFLSHAVVLAGWWMRTGAYWLPPLELFKRIPFAYASFALYSATLTYLLVRLHGPRPRPAAALRFGALAGSIAGAGTVLASYSVVNMPVSALLVWPASTLIESLGATLAAVSVLHAPRPWRRAGAVLAAALLLFIAGVVVQSVSGGAARSR